MCNVSGLGSCSRMSCPLITATRDQAPAAPSARPAPNGSILAPVTLNTISSPEKAATRATAIAGVIRSWPIAIAIMLTSTG